MADHEIDHIMDLVTTRRQRAYLTPLLAGGVALLSGLALAFLPLWLAVLLPAALIFSALAVFDPLVALAAMLLLAPFGGLAGARRRSAPDPT